MAQFFLIIAHLSFSMGPTPLLKMVFSYGLRPRLWLLGPVSRKPRKLFGPEKQSLITRILKTKWCTDVKICMMGISIHMKIMWKGQLCKLRVWDFCNAFSDPKSFRGFRETGPWSYTGRLRPDVQPLTLSYTIFDRKGTPFVYLSLKNGTPFTYHFKNTESLF